MRGFSSTLLTEKNALVIGGTSGIGKSIVESFSQCGANTVVAGRSEESYSNLYFKKGTTNRFAQVDLMKMTVSEYLNENPEIIPKEKFDIIVSSAGTDFIRPLHASKLSDYYDSSKTTVEVAIDIGCKLSKRKYLNDSSSIVFISSVSIEKGIPGMGIYTTSRSGISSISKTIAAELYSRKIRVNTIMAGATKTPMHSKIISRLNESGINKYLTEHPLGFGDPQDIANMVVFLSSDLGKWITGTSINIDGGYSGIKVN